MNIKQMAREIGLRELYEWQDVVGEVVIGNGLSYQGEIEAVVVDACEKMARAVLDAARGMAHDSYVARPNGPNGMDMMDVKIVLLSDLEALFKEGYEQAKS